MLRSTLWIGFFAVIVWAWVVMVQMSTGMGLDILGRPDAMAEMMRQMDPNMDMEMPMAEWGPLAIMWAIMMAAMMLPTMLPTLRSYEDLMTSANGTRAGWMGVLLGYSIIWVVFSAMIAGVQVALLHLGVIDMLGIARSTLFAGGLLMAVGLFQFSRTKEMCHGVCVAPTMYFLGNWRAGAAGGLRMGLGLGGFCIMCCWGFMALGFAGGVMNLAWMGLATVFMIVEKLPQLGRYVTKPMGGVLVLAGIAVAGWPFVQGG